MIVKEIKSHAKDGCLKELSSKENEHVIVDWSEEISKPSYMYVVHQFDKLVEEESRSYRAFFQCYGGDRTGERERRWPEIPVINEKDPPSKLYSITTKVINLRKT